jgi:hypothetical protein
MRRFRVFDCSQMVTILFSVLTSHVLLFITACIQLTGCYFPIIIRVCFLHFKIRLYVYIQGFVKFMGHNFPQNLVATNFRLV